MQDNAHNVNSDQDNACCFKLYLPKYCILEAPIRECSEIQEAAKIYFGEIAVLANKYGFITYTDEMLAEMKGVDTRTIKRWHAVLEEYGFIRRETKNELDKRHLSGCKWKRTRKIYVNQHPDSKKVSDSDKNGTSDDGDKNVTSYKQDKINKNDDDILPIAREDSKLSDVLKPDPEANIPYSPPPDPLPKTVTGVDTGKSSSSSSKLKYSPETIKKLQALNLDDGAKSWVCREAPTNEEVDLLLMRLDSMNYTNINAAVVFILKNKHTFNDKKVHEKVAKQEEEKQMQVSQDQGERRKKRAYAIREALTQKDWKLSRQFSPGDSSLVIQKPIQAYGVESFRAINYDYKNDDVDALLDEWSQKVLSLDFIPPADEAQSQNPSEAYLKASGRD